MTVWRRSLLVIGAVALVAACTGGPSHRSAAPSRVQIGLLAPLTGPRSTTGRDALRGAQLAAELVNQSAAVALPLAASAGLPGLGDATLRIQPADTADPQRAADQAIRLVGQHAAGLVSVSDTTSTALASQRTERIGVPFVDGGASADFLSERGMGWYFRTGPSDRVLGERLLSLLSQTASSPVRKLAIVHSADSAGVDMAVAFKALAGEGGYQVVADLPLPAQADGAVAVVDRLRADAPDAVVAATTQRDVSNALLGGYGALGWHPSVTMAMGAGFAAQSTLSVPGDEAGVLRSVAWSARVAGRNPVARQVASIYKQRFGDAMSEASAEGFSAVLTLAQAIDAAGDTDARRVRAALLALDVPGRDTIMPWDGIRFDEAGQNTQAGAVVERLTQEGVRVVAPPEFTGGA